jgi:hypothetical protein
MLVNEPGGYSRFIRRTPARPEREERIMILLKSCPRCRGDLIGGLDGEFSCIQCGYELKPEERTRLIAQLRVAHRRQPAVARS